MRAVPSECTTAGNICLDRTFDGAFDRTFDRTLNCALDGSSDGALDGALHGTFDETFDGTLNGSSDGADVVFDRRSDRTFDLASADHSGASDMYGDTINLPTSHIVSSSIASGATGRNQPRCFIRLSRDRDACVNTTLWRTPLYGAVKPLMDACIRASASSERRPSARGPSSAVPRATATMALSSSMRLSSSSTWAQIPTPIPPEANENSNGGILLEYIR